MVTTTRRRGLRVLRGSPSPAEGAGVSAMIALVHVYGRLEEALARMLRSHDLTVSHYDVLMCLRNGEGISQQEVSRRVLMTKGNICVIVQKLEAQGLVERRSDPTDQRVYRLYLSDDGRRALARIHPEHHALMTTLLDGFTPDDEAMLYSLLNRIAQSFDDLDR
jgi:DNA-binding MarR family transcriptional regulator